MNFNGHFSAEIINGKIKFPQDLLKTCNKFRMYLHDNAIILAPHTEEINTPGYSEKNPLCEVTIIDTLTLPKEEITQLTSNDNKEVIIVGAGKVIEIHVASIL
ncbi:hypothetical protein Dacet_2647 [Denitrovibrio acetiphilus DSM 12809]|jgi:hypothetical protein|uniref:Uncharacterized protein n=1 Tax=Denitrovibrio acetiphilus (strain DSM 12809 / NBRC 114555 / N2460) TaxID=522772 RepID=D4H549_DENA2|nr:hypothetical protein [Denitrovibrio acetiphilus]ADD69405.1 hypothetical protein Dacet_2647 [Denitrovibrio acetiphilus DSM 12809]